MLDLLHIARRRWNAARWQIHTRLRPDAVLTLQLPLGVTFKYPLRSSIGRAAMLYGFEERELAFTAAWLQPGDTFWDVGANAGAFSLVAARAVGPSGRVIAFEPDPAANRLLAANLAANRIDTVTTEPVAAGAADSMVRFGMATDNALSSMARTGTLGQSLSEWRDVPMVRLDSYMARHPGPPPSLIKMDVEGAEWMVLDGMPLLLNGNARTVILIEALETAAAAFGHSAKNLIERLASLGHDIFAFEDRRRLQPYTSWKAGYGYRIHNFLAVPPALANRMAHHVNA
jgi:FkbM family methyltransferase